MLPKTVKGRDSIWVIVDRLIKLAHFIPIKTGVTVAKLAEIYNEQIDRLHDIPSIIDVNTFIYSVCLLVHLLC